MCPTRSSPRRRKLTWKIKDLENKKVLYLSLGVSRREDARECFADECVESLCASLRSRRYSRSPVMLNGVGVIRDANGGSGTSSTQDSAQLEKKLLFCAECFFHELLQ